MAHILILDSQDTFTYNLVELLESQEHQTTVCRNNIALSSLIKHLEQISPAMLILAGGSGSIAQAQTMIDLIEHYHDDIPMIGIGLGYLGLAKFYGALLGDNLYLAHGQCITVDHDQSLMFEQLDKPFSAGVYHRLTLSFLPQHLVANAWHQGRVVGFRHREKRCCGFQFHPESILTPSGSQLLQQTVDWVLAT